MSDIWDPYRQYTQARIGLGRAGHAVSTNDLLEFQRAHAEARDAVWSEWKTETLRKELEKLGEEVLTVSSNTSDRAEFLKRPDLGRRLSEEGQATLRQSTRRKKANPGESIRASGEVVPGRPTHRKLCLSSLMASRRRRSIRIFWHFGKPSRR